MTNAMMIGAGVLIGTVGVILVTATVWFVRTERARQDGERLDQR